VLKLTITLAQAVKVLSNGKYTIGIGGTISDDDAAVLVSLLIGEITRKDPGFSTDELVRFKAYHVLDALANSPGLGTIVEKKVKDVQWKIAKPSGKHSTSLWMDYADKMIAQFGKNTMPAGVARCDSLVQGLDSTVIEQYGDPSDALI
jgi:hypothetical protein